MDDDPLVKILMQLEGDPVEISNFLADFLSPGEREKLTARWNAFLALRSAEDRSLSQEKIAKKVGCAVGVVSRAFRALQYGTGVAAKLADLQLQSGNTSCSARKTKNDSETTCSLSERT